MQKRQEEGGVPQQRGLSSRPEVSSWEVPFSEPIAPPGIPDFQETPKQRKVGQIQTMSQLFWRLERQHFPGVWRVERHQTLTLAMYINVR